MNILTNLDVVIILQCIHTPKCQVVYFQYIKFIFVKCAPIKLKKKIPKRKTAQSQSSRGTKHRLPLTSPCTIMDAFLLQNCDHSVVSREIHPSLGARFSLGLDHTLPAFSPSKSLAHTFSNTDSLEEKPILLDTAFIINHVFRLSTDLSQTKLVLTDLASQSLGRQRLEFYFLIHKHNSNKLLGYVTIWLYHKTFLSENNQR